MNVLFVTNNFFPTPGGISVSIQLFRECLISRGHTVYVITVEREGALPDPCVLYLKSVPDFLKNIPPIFLSSSLESLFYLDLVSKYLVPELRLFTDKIPLNSYGTVLNKVLPLKIDIVHTHIDFNMGEMALKIARDIGCPVVYTVHTQNSKIVEQRIKINTPVDCDMASVFFGNRCAGVLFPSKILSDTFFKKGLQTRSTVIPTGIDHKRFSVRRTRNIFKEGFVIGTVSRMSAEKNLELLFSIVKHLMGLHDSIKFLAVGGGPMLEYAYKYFQDRTPQVFFTGNVDPRKVPELYNEMDCFLFTSTTETQGMTLTEAQASGLPVIALDCPVSAEVLQSSAFLCKDFNEIAYTLLRLYIADNSLLKNLSEKAVGNSYRFSIEKSTDLLLDFYRSTRIHDHVRTI